MADVDNLIVGAGISGISAAYHLQKLGQSYLIVDKTKPGGLCNTIASERFLFDTSGHVIHCHTKYFQDFVKRTIGANLLHLNRKAYFAFREYLLPYPFQVYFYRIPDTRVVDECIQGLEQTIKSASGRSPRNFEEWIVTSFGEGISKNFLLPYNKKVWRFPLRRISLDWVNRYVPKPQVDEIIKLAKEPQSVARAQEYGYNASFFYPKFGGIRAFVDAITAKMGNQFASSFIESPLQKIDLDRKSVVLRNGIDIKWNHLISTIPLPILVHLLKVVPNSIRFCGKSLKSTSLVSVNIGVRQNLATDAHWIYFPESDIPFHRVVIQSNLSPYVSPDSTTSLIVEKSLRFGEYMDLENALNQTIATLIRKKLISRRSDVLKMRVNFIKYAYPIYDTDFYKKKHVLLEFLREHEAFSIGRFGCWEYLSMEDCFLQGCAVATKIVDRQ